MGGGQQFGDDVVGEVEQLARRLCDLGYRVLIRKTTGGGRGVACFENLRHSYLVVVPSEGCPKQVVVEPRFKDQFVIANPTRAYETLLDLVPETFVGTVTDLMAAVDVLCKEMSTSFRRTGRPLPPWRRKKSLASKWQPKVSHHTNLTCIFCTPQICWSVCPAYHNRCTASGLNPLMNLTDQRLDKS